MKKTIRAEVCPEGLLGCPPESPHEDSKAMVIRLNTYLLCLLLLLQATFVFAGNTYFNGADAKDYQYPIESNKLQNFKFQYGPKTAVVVGAGPAGLLSALVLKQQGFEVAVMELRGSSQFNRFNMVNLKAESETILNDLSLLGAFQEEVASPLEYHQMVTVNGSTCSVDPKDDVTPLKNNFKNVVFAVEKINNVFKNEGLYTVMIAQYQQFLAKAAQKSGVSVFLEAQIQLLGNENEKRAILAKQGETETVLQPDLIILADGASGNVGGTSIQPVENHPCNGEKWVFGNVAYSGSVAFVIPVLDKSQYKTNGSITIGNVIFNPKRHEVNVAVSVAEDALNPSEIKERIERVAKIAFEQAGIREEVKTKVVSDQVVHVKNHHASQMILGKNVILAGDRAGVSSPLAGLGATLATTNYPYGIRELAKAMVKSKNADEITAAFQKYEALSKVFVNKWFDTSQTVKRFILDRASKEN